MVLWALALLSRPATALTLMEALQLAEEQDPTVAGSHDSLRAAEARSAQAAAQLRPQLSVSATTGWNHRDYSTINTPVLPLSTPNQVSNYQNRSAQLTLNQPLWRHANVIAVEESHRASQQSQEELKAARQDMLVRLTQAWVDLMLATDDISAAQQKISAAHLFWQQATKATTIELTGPEKVEEAHAKYEAAVAERMSAVTEQDTALASLQQIVGDIDPFVPPALAPAYVLSPPTDSTLADWLERVDIGPLVEAARQARLAADEEIRKQRAGGGMTVDIVGTVGRNYQQQGNFPGQDGYDISQRSIGLQLALPLYAGGGFSAKVQEAVALRNKAERDHLAALRKAHATAQVAWSGWRSGCVRIAAAQQALRAASVSLQVAEGGRQQGLKFELDVLEARQNFQEAWRDLQKARYDTVMQRVKLKGVAGELSETDLLDLQQNMVPRPVTATGDETGAGR